MLKKEDIRIRDPFILTDRENNCYYMYGTTALNDGSLAARSSFSVYKSYDLESFEEPKVVVDGEKLGLWATRDYWAAEVHVYGGKYYLFGSMKSDTAHRATMIFVCDTPDGEFVPVSDEARTPADWECLDGTLYIEDGEPYMVFCHEWTQIKNGEIWAVKLARDLSRPVEEPFMLFRASDNPNVSEIKGTGSGKYITDGPFLFTEDGVLKMMWSSIGNKKYQIFIAESDSIRGKWTHREGLYNFSGGHAMLFTTLEGERMISMHAPNDADNERACFMKF
jgi:beta-xylosidase